MKTHKSYYIWQENKQLRIYFDSYRHKWAAEFIGE